MASKAGMGLGLLLGVAAAGAGLYYMSTASAVTKPSGPPPPNPVDYDLANLSKQNPGLATAVKQALTTPTAPDDLRRLQQAVQFSYPNLGVALGNRFTATTYDQNVATSFYTGKIYYSLDPEGQLHAYDKDLTQILVLGPPGAQGSSAIEAARAPGSVLISRNPSSAFDALVKMITSTDMRPVFDELQAKTYGRPTGYGTPTV